MKWLLLSLLMVCLACPVVSAESLPAAAVRISAGYLQVRERTNHNDAPEIDRFLAYMGLPKRLSWCAAYVVYCYGQAAVERRLPNPLPKYGRVAMLWQYAQANELRYRTIDPEDVMAGSVRPQPGDVVIWLYGTGPNPNGHTGLVRYPIARQTVATREGNTGPGRGIVREGNGVYDRERNVVTMAGLIRVR